MIDIEEHMDFLRETAAECDVVVEFGVRDGSGSTLAFIQGVKKALYSYDVAPCPCPRIREIAQNRGVQWEFRLEDSRAAVLPHCDFLFIDSLHTYPQLKVELGQHGNWPARYLGFHDTVTFGDRGEDQQRPGLMLAIAEFLEENPHWTVKTHREFNNGLLLLERA